LTLGLLVGRQEGIHGLYRILLQQFFFGGLWRHRAETKVIYGKPKVVVGYRRFFGSDFDEMLAPF